MRIPPARPTLSMAFFVWLFAAAGNGLVAHAEPIAWHSVEFADEAALAGFDPHPNEGSRPVGLKEFNAPRVPSAFETLDAGEQNSDEATAPEQNPGDRRTAPARRRTGQPRSAQAAIVARDLSSSANLATMDEETDWEREIREAMRSYYEQIEASGLVDAIHGLKTHLSLSGAAPRNEATATEYRAPPGVAPWELRDERFDAQGREKSLEQKENEKRIVALLIDEWIAALKPWFFGLVALYALWQVSKLGFRFTRWKSARAVKRGAKKSRTHRTAHGRHAPHRY